jgi:hypothetical protein
VGSTSASPDVPDLANPLIQLLRARAKGQRLEGYAFLGLIGLVLIGTGTLVFFVGDLVTDEAKTVAPGQNLESTFAIFEAESSAAITVLANKARSCSAEGTGQSDAREIQTLLDQHQEVRAKATNLVAGESRRLEELLKSQISLVPTVAAVITRIAVVLLGLFLTQILVGTYRLTARLSATYDAFADALMLHRAGQGDVGTLVAALTPRVDFGGSPKSPSNELIELAATALRTKSDGGGGRP